MENGSIFVGNGDASIIPKWLIQDGMGKHKDKILLCYSFLGIPEYCQSIYEELGIGEAPKMPETFNSFEDYNTHLQQTINDIAVKTCKKLYFSKYNDETCYTFWENRGSLYDLGLIFIDSQDSPIDIYQEQERFFNSTDFSYLDKPIEKNAWDADSRFSLTMVNNFWQLMMKYKDEGDTENYKRVHEMMEKAVNRIPNDKLKEQGKEILKSYELVPGDVQEKLLKEYEEASKDED